VIIGSEMTGLSLLPLAVAGVAGLLVLTKLADVRSTLRAIDAEQEEDPQVARLLRMFGVRMTVWFVFAVAVAIVAASTMLALCGPPWLGWVGVVGGLLAAILWRSRRGT
jgi:hypothetical protein